MTALKQDQTFVLVGGANDGKLLKFKKGDALNDRTTLPKQGNRGIDEIQDNGVLTDSDAAAVEFEYYRLTKIPMQGGCVEVYAEESLEIIDIIRILVKGHSERRGDDWQAIKSAPKIEGERFLAKDKGGLIFITAYSPGNVEGEGCYGSVDSCCAYYEDMKPVEWRAIR